MNNNLAAKCRFRCRRGMLELDIYLITFFDDCFASLSPRQQTDFARLLDCTDPDLHHWLTSDTLPDDPDLAALCQQIRAHRDAASV